MKMKITAAVLVMLLLFSACGKNTDNHKNNSTVNTGSGTAYGSEASESEASESEASDGEMSSEQEEAPQESGELVCVKKNALYVDTDESVNTEYPMSFDKYYYDESGKLVREEHYEYKSKYQTVESCITYEYDENGNCTHKHTEGQDGEEQDEYHEYDAAGNEIGSWWGDYKEERRYDYDDHGSVIAYYEPNRYQGKDGLEYTSEYEYNSDGTVRTTTSYEADYGHQSAYIEYTYDEKGLLVRKDVTSYGEYKGHWEYVYDEYGFLLEAHRYSEYGYEDDECCELYYTEYDEAGNQIAYANLYTSGSKRGTPRWSYRRNFDSNGNITEERRYDYDGKLERVYTYEYAPLSQALWG